MRTDLGDAERSGVSHDFLRSHFSLTSHDRSHFSLTSHVRSHFSLTSHDRSHNSELGVILIG